MLVAPASSMTGAKKQRKTDDLDALHAVAVAQSGGDSLSTPGVSGALSRLCARKLSESTRTSVETALRALRADLDDCPAIGTPLDASAARKYLRRLDSRIQPSPAVVEGTKPPGNPSRVAVVGSFLLGFSDVDKPGADVAVYVPDGFFRDRDVTNFRYHQKRALFLAYVARHLEGCEARWEAAVTGALAGDSTKPVLEAIWKGGTEKEKIVLRVLPAFEDGVFPADKLDRRRRNVRGPGESSVVDDASLATPGYNDSIRMDSLLVTHLQSLHRATSKAKNFVPALRMLVAWFCRRRLLSGSFIPAALLVVLLAQRRVPNSASSAHLFRVAVTRLRTGVLNELELNGVRVCANMDLSHVLRVKEEAAAALVAIDSPVATLDPWHGVLPALFVTARGAKPLPVPLSTIFDAFVRMHAAGKSGKAQLHDGTCETILHKALVQTRRAARVERLGDLLYGITLNSASDALRKVDLCPDSTPEEEFQAFWGDKVQLRRFNDGKIKRSLVWDGGPSTMDAMVQHAVARHLHGSVSATVVLSQLQSGSGLGDEDPAGGARIHVALNELGKMLRSLEALPLRIVSIAGVSAHLRRAAVQNVRPHSNGKFIEPIEVVAFFESSKSWPNDPVAISASKAAFYVALRGELSGQGLSAKATISFLDVLLGGFVFRIRICVEQEKKFMDEKSADRAHLIWQTEARISVHNLLRNAPVAHLGPVSRLAKRWLSSHLLFSQLGNRAEEFVELLVLRAIEGPNARAPNSAFVGFFRFLHLLVEFPWEAAPLVVSATGDSMDDDASPDALSDPRTEQSYEDAFRQFEMRGNSRPGIAITCSCEDPYSWFSSAHSPDRAIVKRIVAAARASLQCADEILQGKRGVDQFETLFRTPIEGVYHLALDLDPSATPRARKLKKGFMRSGTQVARLDTSFVGFNPGEQLLKALVGELGDEAWFMHDVFGGSCIYVGWRPRAFKKRPFSIKGMRFAEPDMNTGELVPDRREMVNAMLRVGEGLILKVRYLQRDEAFPESLT